MLKMEICNDHEDWLHARSRRIGGSDAAAVLGCNPWMTNVQLWKYKTGKAKQKDISDKEAVKYGNNAEPLLRQLFALDFPQYEVLYEENNIFFNDKMPWAHASLDGWLVDKETGRKGILEIKTTNIIQSLQKEKWKNRIPDNYYIQVLHYLMVTGFDFVVLKAQLKYEYDGDIMLNTRHYKIEREEVLEDIAFLEKSEKEFSEYIKNNVQPPLVLPAI